MTPGSQAAQAAQAATTETADGAALSHSVRVPLGALPRRRFGQHLLLGFPLLGAVLAAQQAQPVQAGGSSDTWGMEGNSNADANDFLGTINTQPLVLKTRNSERMRISTAGDVGIGTSSPTARLDVRGGPNNLNAVKAEYSGLLQDTAAVFGVLTSAVPGYDAAALRGEVAGDNTNPNGYAIFGRHRGSGVAVRGEVTNGRATTGAGVEGTHSGAGPGVRGESLLGNGVVGNAKAAGRGVVGYSDTGIGVEGTTGPGSNGPGVKGSSPLHGVEGFGIRGTGVFGSGVTGVQGTSGRGSGVLGLSSARGKAGVQGKTTHSDGGYGVLGEHSSTVGGAGVRGISSGGDGVQGQTSARNRAGVAGQNTFEYDGYGVFGTGYYGVGGSGDGGGVLGTGNRVGVLGQTNAGTGAGVVGVAQGTSEGDGVRGQSVRGYGVIGTATTGNVANKAGVYGEAIGSGDGVRGRSLSGHGVYGIASLAGKSGIYGTNVANGGSAGYFKGNVSVSGSLAKSSGSFKIDHPLDPANKYLSHSFVESPDMLNIYNGNIILDANGAATVELPGYFEALNGDYRYQLTALGGAAPNLHIAQEITNRRFKIAGGTPGLKVSWQVTGIRQDAWARANPIVVEEAKSAEEKGTYLHPQLHGQPAAKDRDYTFIQELAAQMSQLTTTLDEGEHGGVAPVAPAGTGN